MILIEACAAARGLPRGERKYFDGSCPVSLRRSNLLNLAPRRRPLAQGRGYELDFDRLIGQAKATRCYFGINSSPDRLDLSAEHARLVRDAGIKIGICTDAHSTAELDFIAAALIRPDGLASSGLGVELPPFAELVRLLKRT